MTPPLNRRQFLSSGAALAVPAPAAARPKVRAITAFIALDRARWQSQIAEALAMLRAAKRAFEGGGYDVQTIRITTQPFPEYCLTLSRQDALRFFTDYDALAVREGFDANIGPAMVRDTDNPAAAALLADVLSAAKTLGGSLIIGSQSGIHWNGVRAAARLVKFVEEHSPGSAGNFNFAATAMLAPYAPFYPGSYHLGPGRRFSIGTEGANVVEEAFAGVPDNAPAALTVLSRALAAHAGALEAVALRIERDSGWQYMGLDPTPAPLKEVSICAAIEKFIGAPFGSPGTLTACGIITRAVQSIPGKRAGYAGLMLPVLEDTLLARRWSEGAYGVDALLACSAVCGTGLDTIPLPGDVPARSVERMLADVATLAVKWNKPLSARLLPVKGKKAGDRTEFNDPFLVNAAIRAAP